MILPLALLGQETRGTITGRITDPSSAVISGAEVRATNTATGLSVTSKSNEAGNYVLPYLLPGIYTLQSELAGFKKFVQEGIQVRINDSMEVNIRAGCARTIAVSHGLVETVLREIQKPYIFTVEEEGQPALSRLSRGNGRILRAG